MLEEFDYDHQCSLKRDTMAHLGTLDYVAEVIADAEEAVMAKGAARQGLRVSKSARRDPHANDYGKCRSRTLT